MYKYIGNTKQQQTLYMYDKYLHLHQTLLASWSGFEDS